MDPRLARARPNAERPYAVGDSEFRSDLERIRFAQSYSRLAEVTQVVTAGATSGVVHNRLTHTIKVTAVARAVAVRLLRTEDRDLLRSLGGLDHVVVQAAAGAHDLGHPPFGHLGERALDRLARTRFGLVDGFEGNAQTFRILTEIEVHGPSDEGLNLTAAVRAAVLKYPWARDGRARSAPDRLGVPTARRRPRPRGNRRGEVLRVSGRRAGDDRGAHCVPGPAARPADAGVLGDGPRRRHRVLVCTMSRTSIAPACSSSRRCRASSGPGSLGRDHYSLMDPRDLARADRQPGAGLERLRRRLAARDDWMFDEDVFATAVDTVGEEFVEGVLASPYDGSMTADRAISGFVSRWIDHLVDSVEVTPDPPARSGYVAMSCRAWHEVQVLKFVNSYFILERPDLAMFQRGQEQTIEQLVVGFDEWLLDRNDAARAPRRLIDLVNAAMYGYRRIAQEHPGLAPGARLGGADRPDGPGSRDRRLRQRADRRAGGLLRGQARRSQRTALDQRRTLSWAECLPEGCTLLVKGSDGQRPLKGSSP